MAQCKALVEGRVKYLLDWVSDRHRSREFGLPFVQVGQLEDASFTGRRLFSCFLRWTFRAFSTKQINVSVFFILYVRLYFRTSLIVWIIKASLYDFLFERLVQHENLRWVDSVLTLVCTDIDKAVICSQFAFQRPRSIRFAHSTCFVLFELEKLVSEENRLVFNVAGWSFFSSAS